MSRKTKERRANSVSQQPVPVRIYKCPPPPRTTSIYACTSGYTRGIGPMLREEDESGDDTGFWVETSRCGTEGKSIETDEILSYVDLDELGRALAEIAGLKP